MIRDLVNFTLRVDRFLFRKYRYIGILEKRSANKMLVQYIKEYVAEYEKEHGTLPVDDPAEFYDVT